MEAAAPLREAGLIGATARPLKATSPAPKASHPTGVARGGRAPALLCHPVPGEELGVRVLWVVRTASRGMTATPGGGWPSTAPVPMGMCLAEADRDQTAPTAAGTGRPATRETAVPTPGDGPSAPMVPAVPPAPVPCLDAQVAPGAVPPCCTLLLVVPPLVPVVRDIPPLPGQEAAPTAAARPVAPLPRPACRSTPAWEQS